MISPNRQSDVDSVDTDMDQSEQGTDQREIVLYPGLRVVAGMSEDTRAAFERHLTGQEARRKPRNYRW